VPNIELMRGGHYKYSGRFRAGVPNLSLTMYPFIISTDEHVGYS